MSGWAERPDFVVRFSLDVRRAFDPAGGMVLRKAEASPAIDAARQASSVAAFLRFAQFPLWRVTPAADPEGAQRVEVRDWRFPFTAVALVDASNRVLSSSFQF